MQIQMMKLSEIHPYEKNPRFNDGAVEAVANSIKEFGFLQPSSRLSWTRISSWLSGTPA